MGASCQKNGVQGSTHTVFEPFFPLKHSKIGHRKLSLTHFQIICILLKTNNAFNTHHENSFHMINKQTAQHYLWGKNCDSWIFCNSKNLSVKLESMPPGTREVLHKHLKKEQFFFVLNGTAHFSISGKTTVINMQEGIEVSAGTPHFIENRSEDGLDFLVISSPNIDEDREELAVPDESES